MDNELKNVFNHERDLLKNRLRSEWATIKSMRGVARRQHILMYYKFHMIILAAVLIFMGTGIYRIINPPKEIILSVAWVGTADFITEGQLDALAGILTDALAANPDKQRVQVLPFILSGMPEQDSATVNRLAAIMGANDIDVLIGTITDGDYFEWMLGMVPFWAFEDIHAVLHEAGVPGERVIYFMEGDGEPLPRAVFINKSATLAALGIWAEDVYFAAVGNTKRPGLAAAALALLWHG
jgi:hypothetical protein